MGFQKNKPIWTMAKIIKIWLITTAIFLYWQNIGWAENGSSLKTHGDCLAPTNPPAKTLTETAIANEMGWIASNENRCGGYYLEPPFIDTKELITNKAMSITGNQGIFSLHGTSVYQGKVTITQDGQQIVANSAYVYRDPKTEEYSGVDLIGDVSFRKTNDLVLARCGHIDFENNSKTLRDIFYRTAIYSITSRPQISITETQHEHKVYQLSAWGKADLYKQDQPQVYQLYGATYSTCPPLNTSWQMRAEDITLNKETGRGVAKHARLLVKGVPILYAPYLNFPIDSRRQTGFLWPTVGNSTEAGLTFTAPFYWNLAPNYDDTITPSILGKRGLQINNLFRYLNREPRSSGELQITILPEDRLFAEFQETQQEKHKNTDNPVTLAELNRLENASTTRGAISWQNKTRFNDHWTTDIDYNYVSDDYYLTDFNNNLHETTANQILQQVDLNYKGQIWQFTGRLQGYQTLHPIGVNTFYNQYIRLPELILDGFYPSEKTGLNFFIINDLTNFDIVKNPDNQNPGDAKVQPIGNRIHVQPGINFPYYLPGFYVNPRLQFAMTQYDLHQVGDNNPQNPKRTLPIFDVHSGFYFDRDMSLLNYQLRQTLEPQIYYTYVPYRNQTDIPIFDTNLNTLTYEQLFTYNRFSGLDRIGDANQISVGLTTRFIDQQSGYEKVSAGIGQIFYFEQRRVTMCSDIVKDCNDIEDLPENTNSRSPLSGVMTYNLTPHWSASANVIWDSQAQELNNQTVTLQYARDAQHVVSLSYSYVRDGDPQKVIDTAESNNATNNLSQTDLTFTWPLTRDWSTVGRWTENWNRTSFQNLLYGLQYDSCCWAVRVVAGRTFTNITQNNKYQYNTEFYIQFALKGLGNFGTGNPGQVLNSAITNQTNFGQDF